jgi:hypothetical protein
MNLLISLAVWAALSALFGALWVFGMAATR